MSWRTRAKKSAEGNWLRWKDGDKREVYFCADPKETKGKWQDGSPKHSFDFQVIADGEIKTWGASSKSEKLALADEDEMESIIGNNYLVSRSGQGANTVFRFRKMTPSPEQQDAILQWEEDNGVPRKQPQTTIDEEPEPPRRRKRAVEDMPSERAERPARAQPHDLDEEVGPEPEDAQEEPQDELDKEVEEETKPKPRRKAKIIFDGSQEDRETFAAEVKKSASKRGRKPKAED